MDAIVFAAGAGERLGSRPKPLFRRDGRALLDHLLGFIEDVDAVQRLFVVVGQPHSARIVEHVNDSCRRYRKAILFDVGTLRGTSAAFRLVHERVTLGDPVLITDANILIERVDLEGILEVHRNSNEPAITVAVRASPSIEPQCHCSVLVEYGRITSVRRPTSASPTDLAIAGAWMSCPSYYVLGQEGIAMVVNGTTPNGFMWLVEDLNAVGRTAGSYLHAGDYVHLAVTEDVLRYDLEEP